MLTIVYPMSPRQRSVQTSLVVDLFGLSDESPPHVVAENLELPVAARQIVAFTGPSGSGKSSLLRAVIAQQSERNATVCRLESLVLPDVAVIDALGLAFDRATALLSSCGLGEPRLMLRRPCELSDGERWRFRLALALAGKPDWIACDEFTAALDRTLARAIAFNVRRQCDRTGVGFLVATCHDDVLADLAPDVAVTCDHDGRIQLSTLDMRNFTPDTGNPQERSWSASPTNSNSRPVRGRTGRIFLGGITDRTASAACDSSRCCGTASGPSGSASSRPRRCLSRDETATSAAADAGRP